MVSGLGIGYVNGFFHMGSVRITMAAFIVAYISMLSYRAMEHEKWTPPKKEFKRL